MWGYDWETLEVMITLGQDLWCYAGGEKISGKSNLPLTGIKDPADLYLTVSSGAESNEVPVSVPDR